MYIIARMLLGVGILFAIISGSALIGELGYPKERAVLTSLFNASYFIGAIIAAGIAIKTVDIAGDWSWRLPSLLQICPSALQICTVFMLPESPRWLVSQDREDEAFEVLTKYHAEGDAESAIVQAEMEQIRSTIKLELENSKLSWWDMFRTAGMRRRVLISAMMGLFTQMSGNTLLSYYSNLLFEMMGYTTSFAKTRINIANNCWSFINGTIIALIVPRFRRRWMFMLSALSMCSVFIAMTVSFQRLDVADKAGVKNNSAAISALIWYFAYSPTYNIGNNSLTYTYLVELFPYAQRTMGIGVEQIFGKCAGFFSTNVNPIALNAIGWKYMAIYCGWIFFEFLFILTFYPETYNRTLEELAFCKYHHKSKSVLLQATNIKRSVRRQGARRPGRRRCREAHPRRSGSREEHGYRRGEDRLRKNEVACHINLQFMRLDFVIRSSIVNYTMMFWSLLSPNSTTQDISV
jgi:energy-converting hydrogenase Eha subunit A